MFQLTFKKLSIMKKHLLFFALIFISGLSVAQTVPGDCYKKLEDAFIKRGSLVVADGMHPNVIICFFEEDGSRCVGGKVRVENSTITSIFLQFEDNTYELMDKKFFNAKKLPPSITNGISELILTADGEKFKVVFIDKLKPKKQTYKEINLPDDL
jgi:hypothetical protein